MKTQKPIFAKLTIIVAIIALLFTACTSKKAKDQDTSQDTTTQTTSNSDEAELLTTEEPDDTSSEIEEEEEIETVNVDPEQLEDEKMNHTGKIPYKTAIANTMEGDFNGDGKSETMTFKIPANITYEYEGPDRPIEDCNSFISFSDPSIGTIKITTCIGGDLRNLGDLDDDGTDEIGLRDAWFTSNWGQYYVYTYKNGKWRYLVKPIPSFLPDYMENSQTIIKDPDYPKHVIIRYTDAIDGFKIKEKRIKLD